MDMSPHVRHLVGNCSNVSHQPNGKILARPAYSLVIFTELSVLSMHLLGGEVLDTIKERYNGKCFVGELIAVPRSINLHQ